MKYDMTWYPTYMLVIALTSLVVYVTEKSVDRKQKSQFETEKDTTKCFYVSKLQRRFVREASLIEDAPAMLVECSGYSEKMNLFQFLSSIQEAGVRMIWCLLFFKKCSMKVRPNWYLERLSSMLPK